MASFAEVGFGAVEGSEWNLVVHVAARGAGTGERRLLPPWHSTRGAEFARAFCLTEVTDGRGSAVVYVIGGGAGHAVTLDLSLIGAARPGDARIRCYAPTTGSWQDDLAFSRPARVAGRIALPPMEEDLVLLVQPA